MWRRIYALMIKEFLALLKDKRSRTVLIIPPVIQLFIFSYAATFDINHVRFAVYNEDPGFASRDLLARFRGSDTFQLVDILESSRRINAIINEKDVLMVMRFGPNFTKDLLLGRPADLQVIIDGRNSNTALIVLGYVRNIVARYNEDWAQQQGIGKPPARLEVRAWFNPNLESLWFIVPGIVGLLTLVVTILVTAMSVAREREAGTFDQLLVTPLRPVELLLGKALPGFIIGILEATFIIIMALLWFRLPLAGSVAALYLGIILFLLSAIGIGLMISSLSISQQQGLFGAFMFLVPAVILSGFANPIANMPMFMQYLTYFNPMRYYLVILRSVFLEGGTIPMLTHQYWPMAIIGLINLVMAAWLFRHRMY